MITDDQLEKMWHRAHAAKDISMIELVERAMDGDEVCRRIATTSARDVEIYRVAVSGPVCPGCGMPARDSELDEHGFHPACLA